MAEIAGIEHGVLRHFVDGVAVGADVGVGAQQHAEVAVERPHLADRLWALVLEAKSLVRALNRGNRQEGHEMRLHADGPAPGPPPPCGVENVLCRLRWTTSKPMS